LISDALGRHAPLARLDQAIKNIDHNDGLTEAWLSRGQL
jgi:hypothetical protein